MAFVRALRVATSKPIKDFARLACGLAIGLLLAPALASADEVPTPEEYAAHVGGDAQVVPPT